MIKFSKEETNSNTVKDDDLANARELIIIKSLDEDKKESAFKWMLAKWDDLHYRYPHHLTADEKLFFLALTLNLLWYADHTKDETAKSDYINKISQYNSDLLLSSQLDLIFLQKAKWSATIADLLVSIKHYRTANLYYEQAIKFIKSGLDANSVYKTVLNNLLLDILIRRIEANVKLVDQLESAQPIDYELASKVNNYVIKDINTLISEIEKLADSDKTLVTHLYALQATATMKLAGCRCYFSKLESAFTLGVKALTIASIGFSQAEMAKEQQAFLEHLKTFTKQLLSWIIESGKAKNYSSLMVNLKELSAWLEDDKTQDPNKLRALIKAIIQSLTPPTSTSSSAPFWQKPEQQQTSMETNANPPINSVKPISNINPTLQK